MSEQEFPKIERRTYINGQLKGQYQGFESYNSSQNEFERVYDIELTRGQVYAEKIIKWDEVDENQFVNHEKFKLKLPKVLRVNLNEKGVLDQYDVELQDVRVLKYHLSNHQEDGGHVFGDITVNIFAYFVHDGELTAEELEDLKRKEQSDSQPKVFVSKVVKKRRGYIETIKKTASGKTTYSSTRIAGSGFNTFWSVISNIFYSLLFALIFIPVLISGWPVILGIAGILLLFWLLSLLQSFILQRSSWIWGFLGLLFGFFMLSNVLSLLKSNVIDQEQRADYIQPPIPKDNEEQRSQPETDKKIKHLLDWEDYNSTAYQGTVSIKKMDFTAAKNFRNNLSNQVYTTEDYNQIVRNIHEGSNNGMEGVYHMFDSIIIAVKPTRQEFAEIVVSCIQDIPYYLILDGKCDANDYPQGEFIHQYLLDNNSCVDHVKYGLLGPLEFIATLHGDCDTRTLLLYTILKHYDFNVLMLVSQRLQHSILAVELPRFDGKYFPFRNRRFTWWETTQPNIPPGLISNEYANPNLWQVSLL
ncbi:hypothetical protein N8Z47_06080 [Salibacteraceae bacterium]|nr:hypothetical protein [Salibacteraceae bacterium]